ncbi:MAG: hypothetical protein JXM69_14630, partial [Anaerolineae bacterium]|nr:hypothetical protein [Anaerolineae bacterium]
MNEEELLDAEIQKRKRRFLIVLLCFVFVSFGGVLLISPERLTPTEAAAITAQAGVDETAAGIVSESETPAVDIDTSGEIEEQLSPTEEIVGGTGGGTQPG